jgi:hypothetical protein
MVKLVRYSYFWVWVEDYVLTTIEGESTKCIWKKRRASGMAV